MLPSREELDSLLMRSFTEGVRWPIDSPSLSALSDMGLTVSQIARYFSVDSGEVQELLDRHGGQLSNWGASQIPASTLDRNNFRNLNAWCASAAADDGEHLPMRNDRDAEELRQDFITECLVVITVGLAWLLIGLASQKGYLPHP
jgi:hypothetical protein